MENEDLVYLLRIAGLGYVRAAAESDHKMAELCRSGKVVAVLSEDSDLLIHEGVELLIRDASYTKP